MTGFNLSQVSNQELLKELGKRIKDKQLNFPFSWHQDHNWEKKLEQAYQVWANDKEEQEEIKVWTNTELDGWDD